MKQYFRTFAQFQKLLCILFSEVNDKVTWQPKLKKQELPWSLPLRSHKGANKREFPWLILSKCDYSIYKTLQNQ